ncbi:MAG: hotdog fold thioesterase [Caulobacter sp.]|nr:hotdog fold thioesterase [Caulobacter sp.]
MSETVADQPPAVSDEALLQRFLSSKAQPSGSQTLGFRMLSLSQADKRVEVAFEARADLLCNPMGQIQGGFVSAMLDECMSVAGVVASGMTCVMPTLEMKTSFFRPAMPGALRGVGKLVRWGKTIAFLEGELFDDQQRLLAKATATAMPTPFKAFRK